MVRMLLLGWLAAAASGFCAGDDFQRVFDDKKPD